MQPRKSDDVIASGSWSTSLEAVFDEHAEVRDVVVQMQETADIAVLAGLLERLHDLLQAHFEHEERDEGMLRLMQEASPEHRRAGTELCGEHPEILSEVRKLIERVRSGESIQAIAIVREVAAILKYLNRHDAAENELIRQIASLNPKVIGSP